MLATTVIAWALWAYVIWTVNPFETNMVGFVLFYSSLFLSLTGTAAIFGFLVRFVAMKKQLVFRSVKEAFRQSFLFSILVIASLILLSKNLFTWVNISFLIGVVTVLEFFLLGYDKTPHNPQPKIQV